MDENIFKRAAAGDVAAFEVLILAHEKFIYNIALRIMGNSEDAKDISQEAIIKIYRHLKTCNSAENLRAWMARIVHNAGMDELRRRKGKHTVSYDGMLDTEDNAMEMQIEDDAKTRPEAVLLQKELGGQIEQALMSLSAEHRALIVLRDIQGMSYEDIAEITKTPLGTVKSRINRGRNNLKRILIEKLEQN